MKKYILLCSILYTLLASSQEPLGKPFLTGSLNFTLGINEDYTLFNDTDEPFLVPAALFLRTGFGYEFKKRVAISFNAGYDYHWNYAVSAFPAYGALKVNLAEDEGDTVFFEISKGRMWRPSPNYPDGNYFGFGIGTQVSGENRWNTIVRLDFHRKGVIGFENNRIDSISFGIGFSFF